MAKRQTRRTISISGPLYKLLMQHCADNGITAGNLVSALIERELQSNGIATPERSWQPPARAKMADIQPAPMPVLKPPPINPGLVAVRKPNVNTDPKYLAALEFTRQQLAKK